MAAFAPVGMLEEQVVQTLADLQWRLNRIPTLETGILALARRRLAPDLFTDEPDAYIHEATEKSLGTLHRQKQRLRKERASRENSDLFNRWWATQKAAQAMGADNEDEEDEPEQHPNRHNHLRPPTASFYFPSKIIGTNPENN